MALSASDFLLPGGELSSDWFPEIDATAFLTERINQADQRDSFTQIDDADLKEAAKRAFVYEKAYRHIYRRKSEDPNRWTVDDEGSEQQTDRQIERWREFADTKEAKWRRIAVDDDPGDDNIRTQSVPSRSTYV